MASTDTASPEGLEELPQLVSYNKDTRTERKTKRIKVNQTNKKDKTNKNKARTRPKVEITKTTKT
jgi:hypothetical protein